jgi:hypothetical protein
MSDLKFSCPSCQQHIAADANYAGLQINCPACSAPMTVPALAAPAPLPVPRSAYAAPMPVPSGPAVSSGGCPSCGNALPRGAVICTRCGYNLATKTRTVAGRAVPPGTAMAPKTDAPWYKTAPPYIIAVVLVLGGLYMAGRNSPPMMLAFVAILAVYCLGVHILVVVAAFQEGMGQGFLTLCIPLYALYYVYKVSESSTLQLLYSSAVVINIILRFLPVKD